MEKKRNFIADNLKINSWDDIKPYLEDLQQREIKSKKDLLKWWKAKSETEAFLEEDAAWRYIKMTCNTADKKLADDFNFFVKEIQPKVSVFSDIFDRKLIKNPFCEKLDKEKYFTALRGIRKEIEIFRKKNIPIIAEVQEEEQKYGTLTGAMTVKYKGEEMTLQKAANFLKNTDRKIRKKVFEIINERRIVDSEKLNELMSSLAEKRQKIAINADFENYRDYKFASLQRFDYTKEDCFEFHKSIQECVIPIVNEIYEIRKKKLNYKTLKPYDTNVNEELKSPLVPFKTSEELIEKCISVFKKIRPKYGEYLRIMKEKGYLDLDSRKDKAPGGYNYPLYESNIPFIFTNSTGNVNDVETMMHEGGHAIHSFLSSDLELVDFKELPSEVAELASMSMELISMDYQDIFYKNKNDLKRAKLHQLQGVIKVLPWIAAVDKFQHLLYENPKHSHEERTKMWEKTMQEFGNSVVDWKGYEKYYNNSWQKQLHIFEVPFYYIEYGIAQLGAIAIWRNYKKNPEKALNDYENALKLGYSKPIPEIYKTAGIKFSFDKEYVAELMEFVKSVLKDF